MKFSQQPVTIGPLDQKVVKLDQKPFGEAMTKNSAHATRVPQKYLHEKIVNRVKSDPRFPKLKILDLSCGDAYLLSTLASLGCDCVGTRYCEDDYIIQGAVVHPEVKLFDSVDLSQDLPFPDQSFDIVIMKEVIEHLPSHLKIVTEVGRIVKQDGVAILSTPNIHRLHSRLNFFLTGAHKLKRRRLGWDVPAQEIYAYHYNPVDFPILHTMLFQNGLKVSELLLSKTKFKYLFLGLLYPLVYVASQVEYRREAKRSSSSSAGEIDLKKWMLRPAMLFSEQLLIVASKMGAQCRQP